MNHKVVPLVSVIITCYNRTTHLEDAIKSVVSQTIGLNNIELIVIDDGSSDKKVEYVCKIFSFINYYYKENGGLASARNYGIKIANGLYIALLDDDDFWHSEKLEVQLEAFQQDSNIGLVHTACEVVDFHGKRTGKILGASSHKAHLRSGYVFWNALGTWVVKSPTPLIKREKLQSFFFDETIQVGEDIEFYQRFFYKNKVFYIDKVLAYYREYETTEIRLSKRSMEYVGVYLKLWTNLNQYKINPIKKYLIAIRLAKASQLMLKNLNYNAFVCSFYLYIFPLYYLKKFNKIENYTHLERDYSNFRNNN